MQQFPYDKIEVDKTKRTFAQRTKLVCGGILLMVFMLASLLGGCQTTQYAPIPYPMPVVNDPRPVKMNPVEWEAYNRADLQRLIAERGSEDKIALIAVTPEGYKNLTMNLAELERYIKQQKQIIVFLKKTLKARSTK